MDAPLCRICGNKHWTTEPHVGLVAQDWQFRVVDLPSPIKLPKPVTVVADEVKPAAKFDRVAYQREYMRKRRAAKK